MDSNPFSLGFGMMVVGDIISRVNRATNHHYSFLVLKNRKNVIHLLRIDENATKIIRYTAMGRMDCISVLREGVICFNYPELLEASK